MQLGVPGLTRAIERNVNSGRYYLLVYSEDAAGTWIGRRLVVVSNPRVVFDRQQDWEIPQFGT